MLYVEGDRIRRYAWDQHGELHGYYTREELCEALLESHAQLGVAACEVTLAGCLEALSEPRAPTVAELQTWTGVHRDVRRETPKPDDAVWLPPYKVEPELDPNTEYRPGEEPQPYWQQDVVWAGEHPRQGWNRLDERGLYGWDGKLPGKDVPALETVIEAGEVPGGSQTTGDGQGGWKGVHIGYPLTSEDGCACIIWVTSKEAYLECVNGDGLRTAAGLGGGGHQYQWQIEPLP